MGSTFSGRRSRELEERLGTLRGVNHCVTCASGTDALLIALMALGLKPGDEVVTTPFTFVATAEMIVLLGASPVFVDVEPDTCNIDARAIDARSRPVRGPSCRSSLYGQPADMDEINALAAKPWNPGDRGRRAELRRHLQGTEERWTVDDRLHELLPEQAARLLRRGRRGLYQ